MDDARISPGNAPGPGIDTDSALGEAEIVVAEPVSRSEARRLGIGAADLPHPSPPHSPHPPASGGIPAPAGTVSPPDTGAIAKKPGRATVGSLVCGLIKAVVGILIVAVLVAALLYKFRPDDYNTARGMLPKQWTLIPHAPSPSGTTAAASR